MITSKAGRRVSLQKELKMYDKLWEESPTVQKMRAESEAKGFAEDELRALKRVFINVIKVRCPALAELAVQEVKQINDPGALDL